MSVYDDGWRSDHEMIEGEAVINPEYTGVMDLAHNAVKACGDLNSDVELTVKSAISALLKLLAETKRAAEKEREEMGRALRLQKAHADSARAFRSELVASASREMELTVPKAYIVSEERMSVPVEEWSELLIKYVRANALVQKYSKVDKLIDTHEQAVAVLNFQLSELTEENRRLTEFTRSVAKMEKSIDQRCNEAFEDLCFDHILKLGQSLRIFLLATPENPIVHLPEGALFTEAKARFQSAAEFCSVNGKPMP